MEKRCLGCSTIEKIELTKLGIWDSPIYLCPKCKIAVKRQEELYLKYLNRDTEDDKKVAAEINTILSEYIDFLVRIEEMGNSLNQILEEYGEKYHFKEMDFFSPSIDIDCVNMGLVWHIIKNF